MRLKVKESDIQKQILSFLCLNGIYCWTNKTQGTYDPTCGAFRRNNTKKGISDIIGILPGGRFLAIEVKSKYGKPSPEQMVFLAEIARYGGLAFIAKSMEDVEINMPELFNK